MALQEVCGFRDSPGYPRWNTPASMATIDNILHSSVREALEGPSTTRGRDGDGPLNLYIPDPEHLSQNPLQAVAPPFQLCHGTTTLAFAFQGGVIAAGDTRASCKGLICSPDALKVLPVHRRLLMTTSGSAADCVLWKCILSRELRLYQLRHRRQLSTGAAARLLSNMLHPFKGTEVCVAAMLCGWEGEEEDRGEEEEEEEKEGRDGRQGGGGGRRSLEESGGQGKATSRMDGDGGGQEESERETEQIGGRGREPIGIGGRMAEPIGWLGRETRPMGGTERETWTIKGRGREEQPIEIRGRGTGPMGRGRPGGEGWETDAVKNDPFGTSSRREVPGEEKTEGETGAPGADGQGETVLERPGSAVRSPGPQLYYVCSDGTRLQGELFSVGSGSPYAYSVLDGGVRWGMGVAEACRLAREAVFRAAHRDAYSGNCVDLYHVTATGWRRRDREDLKEEYYRERQGEREGRRQEEEA